jgi:hypothetical protein
MKLSIFYRSSREGTKYFLEKWNTLRVLSTQSVASNYPLLLGEVVFDLGAYIKRSSNVTFPLVLNGQTIGHMKLALSIVA